MLKNISIAVVVLALIGAAFVWFISDRDRGLLVLTTALKLSLIHI